MPVLNSITDRWDNQRGLRSGVGEPSDLSSQLTSEPSHQPKAARARSTEYQYCLVQSYLALKIQNEGRTGFLSVASFATGFASAGSTTTACASTGSSPSSISDSAIGTINELVTE